MAKDQQRRSSGARRAAKGVAVTTALAAAAGLVAAGLVYLKRRGIDPKQQAKKAGKRAKQAGTIFSGEAKAAYDDIHAAIILELQKDPSGKVTRKTVMDVIDATLIALKKRGSLSREQFRLFGEQLHGDWKEIQQQARTTKQAKRQ